MNYQCSNTDITYLLRSGDPTTLASLNDSNIKTYQAMNKLTYNKIILFECCKTGQFKFMEWFTKKFKKEVSDPKHCNRAFVLSCQYGHLKISQYLIKQFNNVNVFHDKFKAFRMGCRYGHMLTVQWLLKTYQGINVHAKDEYAIRLSCENGHVDIVQLLISGFDNIDVHVDFDYAFRYGAIRGHRVICELLIKHFNDIDIGYEHNDAFRWACYNGHEDVANWLCEVMPEYLVKYGDLINRCFYPIWI